MLRKFLPNEYVKSIYEISPTKLKERGIKAVITDLDNTLIEWDRPTATPNLIRWFEALRTEGILVTVVSNNNETRVRNFADPLRIPFIHQARKPFSQAFRKAIKQMSVKREEAVVIGDQVLTDVLGGNRGGFYTILVVPVSSSDGWMTRFNRKLERRILRYFKRKGLLEWEEQV
ncbi:YqeG family HAD IIIA-type phosphatase [Bacillus fonticola]|uniref:YqeG family HAD IIIA-type phosphatase n=1 Tax=Bacillus fonticola TaxID=2728853 RepID=UPI001472D370|nr:YqeG family HAD IIIA-type phosphatase [Bacillus fonticola]